MIGIWLTVAILQTDSSHQAFAEQARAAFVAGEFGALFHPKEVVRLENPGGAIGPPVRGPLAALLLSGRGRRQRTLSVAVVRDGRVEGGRGLVELRRIFRVTGTQETRRERILLATVRDGDRWRVTEVLFLDWQPAPGGADPG